MTCFKKLDASIEFNLLVLHFETNISFIWNLIEGMIQSNKGTRPLLCLILNGRKGILQGQFAVDFLTKKYLSLKPMLYNR
ncbi:hypothetical protein BHR79_08215 [Methanohalophilus halophilus]|uniref:Uncharacterized protein n=1 Tax=Methanohalophilus halophilus TaxID=2177 RepID=A0A1L3Q3N6_9EURY|nr:hypothetical protein BHR79_08215 [Methanohalophilus halophilus]RNI07755.1 hypothetical protein EFE40_09430 [Methanohalophilus halophilus]